MDTHSNRSRRWIGCTLFSALVAASAAAGAVTYGPGGLPDLSTYRVNEATFATMAQGLGTPRDLTTDGGNEVSKAIWWLPAQGYAAPTDMGAPAAGQQMAQAARSGFFSRLRSQAVGTVSGMVPGVGGVIAGQAANAVATSVVMDSTGPTPGWTCIALYQPPAYRLMSVSCRPQAYTPMH